MLTLAISKGRILREALPLLARAGFTPTEDPQGSRKLVLDTDGGDLRFLVLRARDVPTFVEHGGADLGITGKDVLLEYEGDGLYEPLDLRIGRCRMMLAAPAARPPPPARLRVATKYVSTTRRHFAGKGEQVEIIPLYGSMELAPLVGLADRIVDLVDTGDTLDANGLEPVEHIADISSRLVVNKAAMKMNHAEVKAFVDTLGNVVRKVEGDGKA